MAIGGRAGGVCVCVCEAFNSNSNEESIDKGTDRTGAPRVSR
jgi:hypothetical protein